MNTRLRVQPTRREFNISELALTWSFAVGVPSIIDLSREICAIGVAALTIGPLLAIWVTRRRLLVNDPIIVLGVAWFLAVSLPVALPDLYKDRMWYELVPQSIDEAARWMYRSWALMCIFYWLGRTIIKPTQARAPDRSDLYLQYLMRQWIGVLAIVGSISYLVVRGGQTSQLTEEIAVADSTGMQILYLLKELGYAYIFLYFFERGRSTPTQRDRAIFYANLVLQLIIAVSSASKYGMMIMIAAWVLGAAGAPSRIGLLKELLIGAGAAVSVVVISYFVAAYREELIAQVFPQNASIGDMLALQFEMAQSAFSKVMNGEEIRGYYANGYNSSFIFDRFAHLSTFAVFMEFIGFRSPYENALASAVVPIFAVIPSALIPDKVHFINSGDFARMYGWTWGGISISLPGSFFWAWGYAGIIAGMAGLGWLISWFYTRSQGWDSQALIYRTTMISAVLALLDVGVTFQMIIVPATRVLLLVILLRWALRHVAGVNRQEQAFASRGSVSMRSGRVRR